MDRYKNIQDFKGAPLTKFLLIFISIVGFHGASFAVTCRQAFVISPLRISNSLQLLVKEQNHQGPACDLVVQKFEYIEAIKAILVDVQPVSFCPVDAMAARAAMVTWQLPQNMRSAGTLQLILNGESRGFLEIKNDRLSLSGGCL